MEHPVLDFSESESLDLDDAVECALLVGVLIVAAVCGSVAIGIGLTRGSSAVLLIFAAGGIFVAVGLAIKILVDRRLSAAVDHGPSGSPEASGDSCRTVERPPSRHRHLPVR